MRYVAMATGAPSMESAALALEPAVGWHPHRVSQSPCPCASQKRLDSTKLSMRSWEQAKGARLRSDSDSLMGEIHSVRIEEQLGTGSVQVMPLDRCASHQRLCGK